jgi:hypothetical protein
MRYVRKIYVLLSYLFSVLVAGAGAGAGASAAGAGATGGGASLVFREGALAGGGKTTGVSSFLLQAVQAITIRVRVRATSDFFMDFSFYRQTVQRAP